jgi:hypothetical protein
MVFKATFWKKKNMIIFLNTMPEGNVRFTKSFLCYCI